MPKKKTASPAVVVIAGQPSAATLAKLKTVGERITDAQIVDAVSKTELHRRGFQFAAIEAGLMLVAKRASLPHGAWLPWVERFAKTKLATVLPISSGDRSLRHYTFLAQHFIADLEQGNFQPEGDAKATPPAVTIEDALALQTLPEKQRSAFDTALTQFIAGRSLRRMLMDFRRAESAADQEEIEEAGRRRKPKRGADDSGQMDFFADMTQPLSAIENLFDDKLFVEKTDRKFWLSIADNLEAKAARARKLAEEIK